MNKKGFTLVELLVFVTILSMFFVTAVSVAVSSLRNIKINEHKILATRYAEELAEWLRAEKEADWPAFTQRIVDQQEYCFDRTPIGDWGGQCTNQGLKPPIYDRRVRLFNLGNSEVRADIIVSWREAGNISVGSTYAVPLTVHFAVWE